MKRYLKISVILFSIFVLAIILLPYFNTQSNITSGYEKPIEINKSLLMNGDIIFRKGRSFVSRMVLQIDNRSDFSHVGIILVEDDSIFVIHSVPDEDENGIDMVKIDDIKTFLQYDRATAVTVYRLNNNESDKVLNTAVNYAKEKAINEIPFDGGFDLSDDERLYCTELIWKAFKKGGVDLIESKFDNLFTPFGKGPFILPSTLLDSKLLTEILTESIN